MNPFHRHHHGCVEWQYCHSTQVQSTHSQKRHPLGENRAAFWPDQPPASLCCSLSKHHVRPGSTLGGRARVLKHSQRKTRLSFALAARFWGLSLCGWSARGTATPSMKVTCSQSAEILDHLSGPGTNSYKSHSVLLERCPQISKEMAQNCYNIWLPNSSKIFSTMVSSPFWAHFCAIS